MRLVVTGASGLLGKHFIKHYSKEYQIIALTRNEASFDLLQRNVIWKSTDYSLSSLIKIFTDADAVLHLASIRPYASGDCYLDNILLDRVIFEAAEKVRLKNITYISSCSVYGGMNAPWSESDEVSPETNYALSKASSELAAKYFNVKYGLKIKVIRLAQVFTHDEYEGGLLSVFFNNASEGNSLSVSVKGLSREYIYIKDVVSALNQTIRSESAFGVFNLGSGELASVRTLGEIISSTFKKPELLVIDDNRRVVNILSLMSSKKFYCVFNWSPKFTLQSATQDIYLNFYAKCLE